MIVFDEAYESHRILGGPVRGEVRRSSPQGFGVVYRPFGFAILELRRGCHYVDPDAPGVSPFDPRVPPRSYVPRRRRGRA